MTPVDASKKVNENKTYLNLYPIEISDPIKHEFEVGEKVRIVKKKGLFDKGFVPRWTEEIFTISKTLYTDPPTYRIKDYNDEEIHGTFYEPELQKTNQEVFRIEKVLRTKGDKILVKWKGYSNHFNSWINKSDLH